MGIVTKASVAAKFETNDKPTQQDFEDLIDSTVFIPSAGAVGVIEVESTASSTNRAVGAFGVTMLASGTTASAQGHLGGGAVGAQMFAATTTAEAQGVLGGSLVFTNADGGITLTDTDAGALAGPVVDLFRDSASPSGSDILGKIIFTGKTSAASTVEYAYHQVLVTDTRDGTEDAQHEWGTQRTGVLTTRMTLYSGLQLGSPTGGDMGLGTLNAAAGLYIDGVQAGRMVQVVQTQDGAVASGTTTIPFDDTIPQNTEGTEFMTLAITPKSASSRLRIDVVWGGSNNGTAPVITACLFRDAIADALAVGAMTNNAARMNQIGFSYDMASPGTSSTTFKVRAGADVAGTTTFNGDGGNRRFGGVWNSSIIITEYLA